MLIGEVGYNGLTFVPSCPFALTCLLISGRYIYRVIQKGRAKLKECIEGLRKNNF